MTINRLTDLVSENRPRDGYGIGAGDVVQFDRPTYGDEKRTERAEGIVQPGHLGKSDEFGRPVFVVKDENGKTWFPLGSCCVRVAPKPRPDDAPFRPFDERKGY